MTERSTGDSEQTLREGLARIEHQQWWEWSNSVAKHEDLSEERIERWREYWVPYDELPEEVKDHDRKWADLVLELLWNRLVNTGSDRS